MNFQPESSAKKDESQNFLNLISQTQNSQVGLTTSGFKGKIDTQDRIDITSKIQNPEVFKEPAQVKLSQNTDLASQRSLKKEKITFQLPKPIEEDKL